MLSAIASKLRLGMKDATYPERDRFGHYGKPGSQTWHPTNLTATGSLFENDQRRCTMLWTIFVILMILWLLGMVSSYTLGGFIHILLLIAIAVVLIRIIQGRNPI
jgi:hypothetical protein